MHAVVDNHLFSPGLQLKEGPGEEQADQGKYKKLHMGQEDACARQPRSAMA